MSEYKKDDITLLCTDRMAYMRSLPDNAFDLAVVDPPYSRAGGTVTRTGGTWSSKYGKAIRDWDVAPSEDYFNELFRVSRNQIIWGGIISAYHRQDVFLYGESCQFQRRSQWLWQSMRGLRLTAMPRYLNTLHKARLMTHVFTHVKNRLRFIRGYFNVTPSRRIRYLTRI